ncbi:MAG: hypothetical protein FJX75_09455 [Armatimonadetes bacterium]|nr:hypothetical protein [Armatimonadota bacterium]
MARFLADENFPLRSVECLRNEGHDVAAVATDSPGALDEEVLSRSVTEGRVLLTFDRDYGYLIYGRRRQPPPGIVYLRFDPETPTEPAERVLALLTAASIEFGGMLTVVGRRSIRQRPLPRHPG